MSRRRIKIPPQVVADLSSQALDGARGVASVLVGVAVLAVVLAIVGLVFMVLIRGEIVPFSWAWAPTLAQVALAIVVSGVAIDQIRNLKR
jgi:hypothetical protein